MKNRRYHTQCIEDTLQVLVCMPGFTSSKTFTHYGQGDVVRKDYNLGAKFVHGEIPVANIDELSLVLTELEKIPNAFVIRGKALDHLTGDKEVRRLGSGDGANFKGNFMTPTEGRRWVLMDVDKCVLPKHLHLSKANLPKILAWVISQLPKELHDVTVHWQLSSSAGVYGADVLSIHLWFWLTEPANNKVLKVWAEKFNSQSPTVKIDTSLFRHVQPHYTAKPVFVDMDDPFPVRSGLLRKKQQAATIKPLKVVKTIAAGKRRSDVSPSKTVSAGFANHLADIGDHPGGRGFRQPLLSASASYVATHGVEGTDPEELYELLRDAVLNADASAHTPDEIEERASRETIMPMIMSALKKFGGTPTAAARKTKLHIGVEPHFKSQPTSVEAIQAELSNMLPFRGASNANTGT